MIRILLDQGLPRSTAEFLRSEGWDVLHVGDIGMSRSSDTQILEYARREHRVIITLDSDFHTILALANASAPSVIRLRLEGLKGLELAYLIRKLIPRIAPQLKKGAMVSVSDSRIRIRTIPLFGS